MEVVYEFDIAQPRLLYTHPYTKVISDYASSLLSTLATLPDWDEDGGLFCFQQLQPGNHDKTCGLFCCGRIFTSILKCLLLENTIARKTLAFGPSYSTQQPTVDWF